MTYMKRLRYEVSPFGAGVIPVKRTVNQLAGYNTQIPNLYATDCGQNAIY